MDRCIPSLLHTSPPLMGTDLAVLSNQEATTVVKRDRRTWISDRRTWISETFFRCRFFSVLAAALSRRRHLLLLFDVFCSFVPAFLSSLVPPPPPPPPRAPDPRAAQRLRPHAHQWTPSQHSECAGGEAKTVDKGFNFGPERSVG